MNTFVTPLFNCTVLGRVRVILPVNPRICDWPIRMRWLLHKQGVTPAPVLHGRLLPPVMLPARSFGNATYPWFPFPQTQGVTPASVLGGRPLLPVMLMETVNAFTPAGHRPVRTNPCCTSQIVPHPLSVIWL